MLLYSKYHTALVVLLTWLSGVFIDKNVPYFPIEISRTGTGPVSHHVFKWGAVSILLPLLWENSITNAVQWSSPFKLDLLASPLIIWPWVVLIAWFPDNTHLTIHAAGVVGLMLCVLLNVLLIGDVQRRLPIVLCALAIEGFRMMLKGFVVIFTELDNGLFDYNVYLKLLLNRDGLRDKTIEHVMNIMYKGVDYCILPQLTVPVFRMTGVMQWIAFYLMMSLY